MNKLKSVIMSCQGKNKSCLHWLYNTHACDDDEEKVFTYKEISFWFRGTGFRNPEKMFLCIGIPKEYIALGSKELAIPTAEYILHLLYPVMSELSEEYLNDKKDAREKAKFAIQLPDGCMGKKVDAITTVSLIGWCCR